MSNTPHAADPDGQPEIRRTSDRLMVILGQAPLQRPLGSEFMPTLDEGDLLYMPATFPGLSAGKAQQILQQTDKLIKSVPEVAREFGKIGRAEAATDPAPLTMIETIVQLKPQAEWRAGMTLEKLKAELQSRGNSAESRQQLDAADQDAHRHARHRH